MVINYILTVLTCASILVESTIGVCVVFAVYKVKKFTKRFGEFGYDITFIHCYLSILTLLIIDGFLYLFRHLIRAYYT